MNAMAAIDNDTLFPDTRPKEAPFFYRLSRRFEEYIKLMRLDRPIGIWLLMWPALWALWIAGNGRPSPKILVIFVLGTVVMRSAGCVINDFVDRNVDPYVRRTRERPLAARRIGPVEALVLFGVLSLIALFLVTRLDVFTIQLGAFGGVLAVSYPFLKRFFPLPQLYLGAAFGWAVPMAYAAQTGFLPRLAWVLFMIAVLWAAIYDTLYAMVDRDDDLKIGVKSSAILFADMDRLLVGVMQAMMLFALLLVGRTLKFGNWYTAAVVAAAVFFVYQQWLIREREPAKCLTAFTNNHYVGMALFIGIVLEYVYA
jgi:4-hydroxybenzoate polyprenyltransferase